MKPNIQGQQKDQNAKDILQEEFKKGLGIQFLSNDTLQNNYQHESLKTDLSNKIIESKYNLKGRFSQSEQLLNSQENKRMKEFKEKQIQREQITALRYGQSPLSNSSRDQNNRFIPGNYGTAFPTNQPLRNLASSSLNVPFSSSAFQKIGGLSNSELDISSTLIKAQKADSNQKQPRNQDNNYVPVTSSNTFSPNQGQDLRNFLSFSSKEKYDNRNSNTKPSSSDSIPLTQKEENVISNVDVKSPIKLGNNSNEDRNQSISKNRINYSHSYSDNNMFMSQQKTSSLQSNIKQVAACSNLSSVASGALQSKQIFKQGNHHSLSSQTGSNLLSNIDKKKNGDLHIELPQNLMHENQYDVRFSLKGQQSDFYKNSNRWQSNISSIEQKSPLQNNFEQKLNLQRFESVKQQFQLQDQIIGSEHKISSPSFQTPLQQKNNHKHQNSLQGLDNNFSSVNNYLNQSEEKKNDIKVKARAGTAVISRKVDLNIETNNQNLHKTPSFNSQFIHPYHVPSSAKTTSNNQPFSQSSINQQNENTSSLNFMKSRDISYQKMVLENSKNNMPSSFQQLKSPVVQSKMFLSPQAKLTGEFPYSNKSSNQQLNIKSDNIQIFQSNSIPSSGLFSNSTIAQHQQNQSPKTSNHKYSSKSTLQAPFTSNIGNFSQTNDLLAKQTLLSFSKSRDNSKSSHSNATPSNEIACENVSFKDISITQADLIKSTSIPNHESTRFSTKRNGIVKSYAANTNQGLIRNYNEDRVSIILNIMKPSGKSNDKEIQWPKCSFFGVYDGHGGVGCADFLRDNLHQFVIKDNNFPENPKLAIINGFQNAEAQFVKQSQITEGIIEKSGSCAIVVMIVGNKCYVANVGDSRAIMSGFGGTKAYDLSIDHKPLDENEYKRIIEAGGKIYQYEAFQISAFAGAQNQGNMAQPIYGPYRVLPGRLSVNNYFEENVTRTFGDIEAKLKRLGGNPNVVIAVPDVKEFEITKDHDFIILGSDGIFDKISTKEAIQSIWYQANDPISQYQNVHEFSGLSVDTVLKFALSRKTMDNITVVFVGFDNLKTALFQNDLDQEETQTPEKNNVNSGSIDDKQIQSLTSKKRESLNCKDEAIDRNSYGKEQKFNKDEDQKIQQNGSIKQASNQAKNINDLQVKSDKIQSIQRLSQEQPNQTPPNLAFNQKQKNTLDFNSVKDRVKQSMQLSEVQYDFNQKDVRRTYSNQMKQIEQNALLPKSHQSPRGQMNQ